MGCEISDSLAGCYFPILKLKDSNNNFVIEKGKKEGYEDHSAVDLNRDKKIDRHEAAVELAVKYEDLSIEDRKAVINTIIRDSSSKKWWLANGAILTLGYFVNKGNGNDKYVLETLMLISKNEDKSFNHWAVRGATQILSDLSKGKKTWQPGFAPYL